MEEQQRPAWMRWGGVILGLAAALTLGLWLKDFLGSDAPPKKQSLQQITLIKPPPSTATAPRAETAGTGS